MSLGQCCMGVCGMRNPPKEWSDKPVPTFDRGRLRSRVIFTQQGRNRCADDGQLNRVFPKQANVKIPSVVHVAISCRAL